MSFSDLLTKFAGRIRRGQFWTALAFLAPFFLVVFVVGTYLELRMPVGWNSRSGGRLFLNPGDFLVTLACLFPLIPISVKRLHDRGKSGWWSIPMIVVPVLILFFALPPWHRPTGWSPATPWTGLTWSPPELWIGLVALALVLLAWWVIELGMRPGAPGPNRYGPAEYPAIGSARGKPAGE